MSTRLTEMNAKITADTNNVLAGFEKVKRATQDIGRTAQQSTATAGASFDKLVTKADKVANASSAILNSLYALEAKGSARVLALGNAFGSVIGLLGPQGKMVQGLAIVGSAITALFLQAKEKSAEARKAIEDDINALANAGDLSAIDKQLAEAWTGSIASGGSDGLKARQEWVALLKQELATIESGAKSFKSYAEFQQARRVTSETLERESAALATLEARYNGLRTAKKLVEDRMVSTSGGRGKLGEVTATAQSPEAAARSAQALADKLATLQKRAAELYETLSGSSAVQKAANDIEQWARDAARAGLSTQAIRAEVERLTAALAELQARNAAEELKAFTKTLDERAESLRENLKRERELIDAEKAAGAERARTLVDLQAEITARTQGTLATEAYLAQRARLAIVEAEVARVKAAAKAENREATDVEIAGAKQYGNQLADLTEKLAAFRDVAKDGLLATFAELAQQATQIATSLGEGGRNIARIAAIAGPLFSGFDALSKGLQLRDKLGNIVKGANGATQSTGFFSALKGANGKESQGQAISGTLAVIGAVATIADALDLFGTRAKQKAREMQEAAREFAKGLEDFVAQANPTTGASAAIKDARRRAEDLAKQAAAAGGGTFTFDGTELTAAQLRQKADELNRAADDLARRSPQLAAQLRTVATGFADLATGLDAVEAAAREQVIRNTEDLNVRKLVAAGLTEEAAALRDKLERERAIRAAEGDRTEEGIRYLALLKDTIAAEEARTAAEARRTSVLQLLDDSLSILGGSSVENLQTTFNALKDLFPQFAGLFDGLDLSTEAGLTAARENLRELFRTLSADGITDAERPIVEAIKRLLGSIDSAFGDLTDPLTAALDAFAVRVEVFGLDAAAQFALLADIFRDAFPDVATLLEGAEGGSLEDLRTAIQARIAGLLEGGITEAERPLLAAFQQLLATVVGQIDDAAQEAEAAAQEAETARQQRVSDVSRRLNGEITLGGLTGVDALQARARSAAGQSPILAQLLPLFSDTSASGIRTTKDALFQLFRDLEAGRIPLEQFGDLTKEEIIDAILELNGNLDGLAESLSDAAKAAAEAAAAERQATTDLRNRLAKSRGEETRLAEFDTRAQLERDQAITAGRSAAFLTFLDQVLSSERSKLLADIAGEATSAAVTAAAEASARAAGTSAAQLTRTVGNLTEVTGQTIAGYLREVATNTRTTANASLSLLQVLSGLRVNGSMPIPAIPLSGARSGGSDGPTYVINLAGPVVHAPAGVSPTELGTAIGKAQMKVITEQLGKLTRTDVRALGKFVV